MRLRWPAPLLCLLCAACASPLDRGEELYRQGDIIGALELWRGVPEGGRHFDRAQTRLQVVEAEFDRMLRRYEKRAAFFESEGRLAEAVLYFRLTLKMDRERDGLLDRVQRLARELAERKREEREGLTLALENGDLGGAAAHGEALERLDPFDPAALIEIRRVRAAKGERILRYVADAEAAYAAGNRPLARALFEAVIELDPRNEKALGWLSYIERDEALAARQELPPPPREIPQEDILAEGHYSSGAQRERAGEPFRAIAEYESALRAKPDHERAQRALDALRSRLRPRVPALYERGKQYFQDEDLHNALRSWRQVLLISPGDKRARENAERAERMLARLEELQAGG